MTIVQIEGGIPMSIILRIQTHSWHCLNIVQKNYV